MSPHWPRVMTVEDAEIHFYRHDNERLRAAAEALLEWQAALEEALGA